MAKLTTLTLIGWLAIAVAISMGTATAIAPIESLLQHIPLRLPLSLTNAMSIVKDTNPLPHVLCPVPVLSLAYSPSTPVHAGCDQKGNSYLLEEANGSQGVFASGHVA